MADDNGPEDDPPTATARVADGTTELRPRRRSADGSDEPGSDESVALTGDLRIGPWRLLRQMGRGGMGTVYLAARADDEYKRHVALKVIRAGEDGADVVTRFRRERQILAALDHPYIAGLLDGGTTDDGRPYLVMELVDGRPIHRYCEENSLGVADRLRLFRQVCEAVQHAHRNLVVHRDLKPSNILVTATGVPKLLDFGIAKLLDPVRAAEDAPTATGVQVMTPEFASPEQARGGLITTSTDVYSLGVVLYVLLAGRLPYRLKSRQTLDVLRAVLEEDPERPSTAVTKKELLTDTTTETRADAVAGTLLAEGSPARLRRRLQGDLDTIVLTALRKEPQHRYASVEALSEDIRRHLEGLPILARRPTLAYRAGKFVRRHRFGVAAAATLLVLLAGTSVRLTLQERRTARERDKAERLADFLLELFALSGPERAKGSTITAREVLDRGAQKIGADLGTAPEVRASLMSSMARAYEQLGLYDRGLPLARGALELRRKALGPASVETAASLNEVAAFLWRKGELAEAEASYRQALELRRRLLGPDSREVVESLSGLGNALYGKGDRAGAIQAHQEAVSIARRHPEYGPRVVTAALSGLATDMHADGRLDEAKVLYRECLEVEHRTEGDDNPRRGPVLFNLAILLGDEGDFAGSDSLFREGLGLYRKTLGDEHPEVGRNLNNFAVMLQNRGDLAGALAAARESLAIYRKALPDHPALAPVLDTLAGLLTATGRPGEAEPVAREAVERTRKAVGDDHPDLALELVTLADALAALSRRAEAEPLYRQALAIQRKTFPSGNPDLSYALVGLGTLLTVTDRAPEAETLLQEAVATRRSSSGEGDWRTAAAESALGECLLARGRRDDAETVLLQALAVLDRRGSSTLEARANRERLVALYESARQPEKAARYRTP